MITRIITSYFTKNSTSTGGAYTQQLEALTITKIQNYPRTQFWIDINKEISKWTHKGEQIMLKGYWNSEISEESTWIEKQGLTNTI